MFMMMAANLVGFVVGIEGTKFLFSQLFGTFEGFRFLTLACACMFVGAQLMMEYRSVYFVLSFTISSDVVLGF
jgi:hypothetical protein